MKNKISPICDICGQNWSQLPTRSFKGWMKDCWRDKATDTYHYVHNKDDCERNKYAQIKRDIKRLRESDPIKNKDDFFSHFKTKEEYVRERKKRYMRLYRKGLI